MLCHRGLSIHGKISPPPPPDFILGKKEKRNSKKGENVNEKGRKGKEKEK
jgi:hypothetical protein